MKIVFRTDASVAMGSGHVMRCAALGNTLMQLGHEISFVCRDLPGNRINWLRSQGFNAVTLPAAIDYGTQPDQYESWLGTNLQQEIAESEAALAQLAPLDWLVVDHYALGANWEGAMRSHSARILAVDDLANRTHDCDILLDQSLPAFVGRYAGRVPDIALPLLGPRFALLREEFAAARQDAGVRTSLRRILLFMGGGDATNNTGLIVAALARHGGLSADVVIDQTNPHRDAIATQCSGAGFDLHVQTPAIAELMLRADLMIGAAGSTTWERCCLGLPSILFSIADNQADIGREAARHRFAFYLGPPTDTSVATMTDIVAGLQQRPSLLARLGRNARKWVDGLGAMRVAAVMETPADRDRLFWLRAAHQEDSRFVFDLRNDPNVYAHFLQPAPVDAATHDCWYAKALDDPSKDVLIIENTAGKMGVLRFEIEGDNAVISISLHPDVSGRGWGSKVLTAGCERLERRRPVIKNLIARILPQNVPSLRIFAKAGFQPVDSTTYTLTLNA